MGEIRELARVVPAEPGKPVRKWDGERGGYRPVPLADALQRGGPLPSGVCLEVGSGTGLLTGLLTDVWPKVVSLDLTWAMLTRSSSPRRVLGDASRLPFRAGAAYADDARRQGPSAYRRLVGLYR